MLITSSWLIDIVIILITVTFAIRKYFSRNYDYWKKRGIYYIEPKPFFGNLYDVITFKISMGAWQKEVYNSSDEPYVGVFVFSKPVLTLRSPEIIKDVLVKHFNHFTDKTVLAPDHDEAVSHAIGVAKGGYWKTIRPKITPAFTSGKLKGMFPIVKDIGQEMNQYIKKNQGLIESKELASKYATEVIARTAFGIRALCFEMEQCEFRKIGRMFFDFSWKTVISQSAYFFMQDLANLLRLDFIDHKAIESLKKIFWHTIEERERTNVRGNDLIDILVDLKNNTEFRKKAKFEGDRVLAQPINFFIAGVESTSQAISFTLYELCLQPTLQNELREEILTYLRVNKEIAYDTLRELKLLEMCIFETLRKYPVLPFIDRRCTSTFTIPGTDIVIDEGISVFIPMLGLHYDEKYFPDPENYNPQRFSDRTIYNQNGLYYLPFGEGPRICIGERFAIMNMKIALINILSQFVIERTPDTPVPLEFSKKMFTLIPVNGLPMKFTEFHPTE